jgi:NADPH-dependent 2,4-dienoyl-CoA reductase/sulfur reductase-like enzyme
MDLERRFDVLVVGAGPAGLAAAAAAECGRSVGLADENPAPGGQIWRGESLAPTPSTFLGGVRVFAQPRAGALWAEAPEGRMVLLYDQLILAPGARERFLPFPGWTLPNVTGAGGLQALVKSGLSVAGKAVVVAGSGPLLLAVAGFLLKNGAVVRLIAEQALLRRVARFGLGLARSPGKFVQATGLLRAMRGVPYRPGCWPAAALGEGRLHAVTLTDGSDRRDVPCDFLACGFGLVPNTELPRLLGCLTRDGVVTVDDWQQTTVPDVFCVGEATGVGGLDKSLVEGRIAGYAAGGRPDAARRWFPARDRARRFASSLARAFALRAELKRLPHPETLVCRCEDVTYARLLACDSPRAAKLQTRCGMGPCQGRICGPAVGFLRGWPADTVRPPSVPVRLGSLAAEVQPHTACGRT